MATRQWERLVSLPLFPGMTDDEVETVMRSLRALFLRNRRPSTRAAVAT